MPPSTKAIVPLLFLNTSSALTFSFAVLARVTTPAPFNERSESLAVKLTVAASTDKVPFVVAFAISSLPLMFRTAPEVTDAVPLVMVRLGKVQVPLSTVNDGVPDVS